MAITSSEVQQRQDAAARDERLAKAFQDQGNAARAQFLRQRSQNEQGQAAQVSAVLNRNVPAPSGPQQYIVVKDRSKGKVEMGTYEPVTVNTDNGVTVVETRGLLSQSTNRYTRYQPYVKERLVIDAQGNIIGKEEYDTYETKNGTQRSFLTLRENDQGTFEEIRNSSGELVRRSKTDPTTGVRRDERGNPGENAQREQALRNSGLSEEQISSLTPGQQRAYLDPANAQRYTGTPVPSFSQTMTASVQQSLGSTIGQEGLLESTKTPEYLNIAPNGIKYSEPNSLTGGGSVTENGRGPPAGLPSGVYTGNKGELVIIKEGTRAKTAGELLAVLPTSTDSPFFNYAGPQSILLRNADPNLPNTTVPYDTLITANPISGELRESFLARTGRANFENIQGNAFKITNKTILTPPATSEPASGAKDLKLFTIDTGIKLPTTYTSAYYKKQASDARESSLGLAAAYEGTAFVTGVFEGVANPILDTSGFLQGVKQLVLHPIKSVEQIGVDLVENPAGTSGQLLGGLLLFKGVSKGVSIGARAAEAGVTRLSPGFRAAVPAEEGSLLIKDIPTSKGVTTIRVVRGIGEESLPEESLRLQAQRAGTTVNAVSGARNLFSPLKNQIVVEKPLPTPDASPLERSFFYDPEARLRPSRLGLTQEVRSAGVSDILTGNFQFLRDRPQAILTPAAKVENFPESLQSVRGRLLANQPLSPTQEASLLEFQLKPSGQLKPVGFITREPEVSLAPGEVLQRVPGQGGVTLLAQKGEFIPRRVPIIEAEILGSPAEGAGFESGVLLRGTSAKSSFVERPLLSPQRALAPVFSFRSVAPAAKPSADISSFSQELENPAAFSLISGSGKIPAQASLRTSPLPPSDISVSPPVLVGGSGSGRGSGGGGSPLVSVPSLLSPPSSAPAASPVFGSSPLSLPRNAFSSIGRIIPPAFQPDRSYLNVRALSLSLTYPPDNSEEGFNLLVKRKGKFSLLTTESLSRNEALRLGAREADISPVQTFKIIPSGKKIRASPLGSDVLPSLSKFTTRDNSLYREKQKNLIDTLGEVQQISLKGVLASSKARRRSLF